MEAFLFAGIVAAIVWGVASAAAGHWWQLLGAVACAMWLAADLWREINDPRHYDPRR